jgi:hypothetical protein
MRLRSRLFHGDPNLEAAAVSDPAHIMIGAKGEHVRKIQIALNLLDRANIAHDGAYGPKTAAAVLAYKTKRNIVNRSYEKQADNIVGKMTIAALDQELARKDPPVYEPEPFCQCGNQFARHSGRGRTASPRLSVGFLLAAQPLQVGQPAGGSPKAAALSRVGKAKEWITTTIAALERANTFQPEPTREWQGLNANFGLPHGFSRVTKVPGAPLVPVLSGFGLPDVINTKEDYTRHLIHMYSIMRGNLDSSGLINETFLKKPGVVGEKTYAITLTKDNNVLDPSLPDGLYFTPFFATAGPNKQTEVLVHERAHFLANTQIQDVVHPDDTAYESISPRDGLHNAYSYSTFIIHSMFHFTGVLDHNS